MSGRLAGDWLQLELLNRRSWRIGVVDVQLAGQGVSLVFGGGLRVALLDREEFGRWLRSPTSVMTCADTQCREVDGALVFRLGSGGGLVEYLLPAAALEQLRAAI